MGVATALARGLGNLVRAYRQAADQSPITGLSRQYAAQGVPPDQHIMADADRYATSDDVYSVVNLLSFAAASVPLRVLVNGEPDPEHDLQLLLDTGNNWHGPLDFWSIAYANLWTTGEAWLQVLRTNPYSAAMPNALRPISGEYITPKPGPTGLPTSYRYRAPNAPESDGVDIPPEDMVPVCLRNPRNPLRGLSPLSALRVGLESERQAKLANLDLFRNGTMTDGLIGIPNATQEQRDSFLAQMRSRHTGNGKRHQLFVANTEVQVQRLSLTPRDVEFIELDKLTTRDVAKAYNVPPMFLGDLGDATFSNYAQAWRSLWELAVMPKVSLVCGKLTVHLARQWGPEVTVEPDRAAVAALRDDEAMLAAAAKDFKDAGFDPLWIARRLFGPEVPEEAIAAAPVSLVTTPAPTRAAEVTRADKRAKRDQLAAAQAALEPAARRQVDEAFAAQWSAVEGRLNALDVTRAALPDDLEERLWAEVVADPAMLGAMRAIIVDGSAGGAAAAGDLFGLHFDTGRVHQSTLHYAERTAAEKVAWVNDYTRELLHDAVTEATTNGEGLAGVRDRLRAAFRGSTEPGQEFVYADRVENIAQTELGRAYNHGTTAAMQAAGISQHEWSYSGLPNSRHGDIDGQVRNVGEAFDVHGHEALYPGAETLPAGEACRCKCVTLPVGTETPA